MTQKEEVKGIQGPPPRPPHSTALFFQISTRKKDAWDNPGNIDTIISKFTMIGHGQFVVEVFF